MACASNASCPTIASTSPKRNAKNALASTIHVKLPIKERTRSRALFCRLQLIAGKSSAMATWARHRCLTIPTCRSMPIHARRISAPTERSRILLRPSTFRVAARWFATDRVNASAARPRANAQARTISAKHAHATATCAGCRIRRMAPTSRQDKPLAIARFSNATAWAIPRHRCSRPICPSMAMLAPKIYAMPWGPPRILRPPSIQPAASGSMTLATEWAIAKSRIAKRAVRERNASARIVSMAFAAIPHARPCAWLAT